jgi:hypothetical protein
MSKVRRVLRRCVQTVRARWNADAMAAAAMGWTVDNRRLGRIVVRDPRFDQLSTADERVRASVSSGRWL